VTEGELSELLAHCPSLFHVAAEGAWPAIARHGLWSSTALLARAGLDGSDLPRRDPRVIEVAAGWTAMLRDQRPMDVIRLSRCVTGATPAEWVRLLNGRVFFWLTAARRDRLLGAGLNRGIGHDVLELDAAALIAAYRKRIALCPINSGATIPFGTRRSPDSLRPIATYDYAHWRARRPRGEAAVELSVADGIADIATFVRRVVRFQGMRPGPVLFER